MSMDSDFVGKRDMKLSKLEAIIDKIQQLNDENINGKVQQLEASLAEEAALLKENKHLRELLQKCNTQEKTNMEAELNLQKRLDELQKLDDCVNDLQQNLVNTYKLIGFHVKDYEAAADQPTQQITLAYNKDPNFFVVLKHSHNSIELLEMQPAHPLLTTIQEYLLATQDVRNFLEMVERFFYMFKQSNGKSVNIPQ